MSDNQLEGADRIIAGVMAVSILLPIIVRPPRRQ